MKTRDKKDLQIKTVAELKKMLKDAQGTVLSLKLDKAQAKLKDTQSIFHKKKEIAIIQTILRGKGE